MLTDQQRELVENNTPLAVKCGWKWKRRLEDTYNIPLDECISMCYEGLCKAAKGYDESKEIKFSTFAYKCMNNEFYLYMVYQNKDKRKANVGAGSLQEVVHTDQWGNQIQLVDVLPSEDNIDDDNVLVQMLIEKLNQKEIDFLTMYYLQGMTYQQIGDKMGTSYQNAQQKIRNTVKKCKKLLSVG